MNRGFRLTVLALVLASATTAFAQWSSDTNVNLTVADGNGEQVQPKIAPTADGGCYISWYDSGATTYRLDTWTWSGTAWTNAGLFQPGARARHAMAYDSARNRTVVFGGIGSSGLYSDTWEWNNTAWSQVNVSGPSARESFAMVYDAARGVVTLFGGLDGSPALLGDTWTYNGTAWTQLSPGTSPSARKGHSMTYDSVRQVVVLFGGEDAGGKQADTWEWNGTTWTQVTTASAPTARSYHATAFDPVNNKVLLFGGSDSGNVVQGDTWLYDGVNWTVQAPATSPSARSGHAMANDFTASGNRVVVYGGNTGTFNTQGMFEWSGTTWASKSSGPSSRNNPAMAFDSTANKTVLFGGIELGGYDVRLQRLSPKGVEMWPHNGVLIADRSVSSTVDYGMVCDGSDNAVIAFNDDRFAVGKITVQKVSPTGTLLWNGIAGIQAGDGSTGGSPPKIAALSDAGYAVIWSGTTSPTQTKIQKLDANGNLSWPTISQGDQVPPTPRPLQASDVQPADLGGFIVLFVRCNGSSCGSAAKHLYAQKYDGNGAPQWGGGAPIVIYTASGLGNGYFPTFLSDGAGGAVFGWYEGGLDRNAFVQHVLSDGTVKFASPVSSTVATASRVINGAGVAYNRATSEYYLTAFETDSSTQAQDAVLIQKFDTTGTRQWGDFGLTLLPAGPGHQPGFVQCQVMGDGVTAYWLQLTSAVTRIVAAAHVDSDQSIVWNVQAASNGSEDKSRLTSTVSACGYHIVAFGNGASGSVDIRAQNVRSDGTFGPPAVLLGDMNCDGVVNTNDIGLFIDAVMDSGAWTLAHPCCEVSHADMNADSSIDGLDLQGFTSALVGP